MNDQWDHVRANGMIGKTALVGISYWSADHTLLRTEQFQGEVIQVSPDGGIVLRLRSGAGEFTLPPDLSSVETARPGEYHLKSSGEVVSNPDFLCTYDVYADEA